MCWLLAEKVRERREVKESLTGGYGYTLAAFLTIRGRIMKQKKTKPLHKQKEKKANSPNDLAFGNKFSTNAWFGEEENYAQDENWSCLKNQLIKFHDTANHISLKTFVEMWELSPMNCGSYVIPLLDFAERLFALAIKAMHSEAYHVVKLSLIAAGFLLQSHTSTFDDMKNLVCENDSNDDDSHDARLAETLPFCHDIYMATQSPDTMLAYLNELNIDELRARVASAEPTHFNHSHQWHNRTENQRQQPLYTKHFLDEVGDISTLSNVRIKHNGSRMFLSGSGKKSLARLGFASDDVIEVEDISSVPNCLDITNLSLNSPNSQAATTAGGGKRSKRKGKNKKGKKK